MFTPCLPLAAHSNDSPIILERTAWREGRDLQLDKAVEWLQQELRKKPVKKPERPLCPNYHNREITKGK
jgi:hypothetical protein